MRFLFLFAFLVLTSALPPISEEDVNDNEIEVRHFDKCSKSQYFDIFTARCLDCTPCKPSEFMVFGCRPFDNYVCSNCESTEYKGTFIYEKNCNKSPFTRPFRPFRLRDGMTNFGLPDKDTPFKIVSNDHLSRWNEDDSDEDVFRKLPLHILDDNYDSDSDVDDDEEVRPKLPPRFSDNDDDNSIDRDDSDDDDDDEDKKPLPKLPPRFSDNDDDNSIDRDDSGDDEDDDEDNKKPLPKLPPPFSRNSEDDDDGDDEGEDDDEKPLPKLPSPFSGSSEDDDDDNDNYGFIRLSNFRIIRLGVSNNDDFFKQFFGRQHLISSSEIDDSSADISDDADSEEIIEKAKIGNKLPTIKEESSESSASDDDGSSSESESNGDSEEASQSVEQDSEFTFAEQKDTRFSVYRCNQFILFLIIIGFKVLIIYLVVSRCCCRQMYRHRNITVLNVPEMSPEDNNVLIRAVGFLEDKYAHNGKYQRLIGDDV